MAPTIGLWVFEHGGWTLLCIEAAGLNLLMFADRLTAAAARPAAAPRRAAWSLARPGRVAGAGAVGHAVPLLLRLRRHHQLRGDVQRGLRRVAAGALLHRVLGRHPGRRAPIVARLGDRVGHRRVLLPCLVLVVAGLRAARRGRQPDGVRALGAGLRHRLRIGLSALPRPPDAPRRPGAARRGVRQHPGGVRHRHRHRVDGHRLDRPALRLPSGLRRRRACWRPSPLPYFLTVEPRVLPADTPVHACDLGGRPEARLAELHAPPGWRH